MRGVAVLALLALASPVDAGDRQEAPRVRAGRATVPPHIDGHLDDPVWADAPVISDLTEQSPHPGAPSSYRTEVRILADAHALYLGVTCFDPEPRRIAMHGMKRDCAMAGDDSVGIVLDTFGDRTTGYTFRVNAAGARRDGLLSGGSESSDWDGVWTARASRGADRWTVEAAIPALSLRFASGASSWGFNVERYVARDRTTLRWSGAILDASFTDLRRAGDLEGVGVLEQGKGWSLAPYVLGTSSRDFVAKNGSSLGKAGLDMSYNLGPELAAILTLNTDFAETEVDARRVNLTRFPLFFPEKRAFFTEGANQFDFGLGLGEEFVPFFTRRVGLFEGAPTGIAGGLKAIGHYGKLGIGALDVQTKDGAAAPATNLFAGRFTYDLTGELRVGLLGTNGSPDGVSKNRLFGCDAVWRTSSFRGGKNFEAGVWAARTDGDVPDGDRGGYGFRVAYPNDLFDSFVSFEQFGGALDPALGFLPRPGTRWFSGGNAFQPRPQHGWWAKWIRQFFFETYLTYVETLDGRASTWEIFVAPFNVSTHSGEHLEVNWVPQFEQLDEPFEVARGVIIPAGGYDFTRFRAEAQSALSRPWRVGTTVWFGGFYDGQLTQVEPFVSYTTTSGRFSAGASAENDYGTLPEGDFVARVWQLSTTLAFTPDIVLTSDTQYDNESRNVGVNLRLRYSPWPGTDLFAVWNRGYRKPIDQPGWKSLASEEQELSVKLRYTWRR